MKKLKTKNHYVPKIYLKQWATDNRLNEYKLLVSHERVPNWDTVSISNTSSVNSLYLYFDEGELTDEMEDYFSLEFETKYNSFLEDLNSYKDLVGVDHDYISKLVAGQFLRTLSGFKWSQKTITENFSNTVNEIVNKIDNNIKKNDMLPKQQINTNNKLLPLKVEMKGDNEGQAMIKVESYAGKSTWLMGMKHILGSTYKVLNTASWRVYDAPVNFQWVTSDDPVVFLNYYGKDDYDFNGGLGNPGTEIIFPLSPSKLLYTKIGMDFEELYETASYSLANMFQKIIVEHAFSKVYSVDQNRKIIKIRKRTVSEKEYRIYNQSLKNLHENYMNYEVPYLHSNKEF